MDWFSWLSKTNLDSTLVYEYGLLFTRNELQGEDVPHFDHEFLQSMGISVAKHRLEILKLARKETSAAGTNNKPISGLMMALHKTKKSFGKYIGRLIFHDDVVGNGKGSAIEPVKNKEHYWRAPLSRKYKSEKEFKEEKPVLKKNRSLLALSGPLDGRLQDKFLIAPHKSSHLSGPLVYTPKSPIGPVDMKAHEKAILALRSPKLSGPLEGWATNRSPRLPCPPAKRATRGGSPRVSGPLEGTGPTSPYLFGNLDRDEFDEHSLWTKMFHDMKPT